MRFRFSITGLLATTAYVALAAAAIGQLSPLLADMVWAFTILAFCYAVLVVFAWDKRRPAALGFIVLVTANVAFLYLAPSQLPASHALELAGYSISSNGYALAVENIAAPGAAPQYRLKALTDDEKSVATVAHAAGTMAAGLLGCALGAMAFRRKGE